MTDPDEFPATVVDGLDPQEALEQAYDPATDVEHEPGPDAEPPA